MAGSWREDGGGFDVWCDPCEESDDRADRKCDGCGEWMRPDDGDTGYTAVTCCSFPCLLRYGRIEVAFHEQRAGRAA